MPFNDAPGPKISATPCSRRALASASGMTPPPKTITRALRDHGFEVIYTGLHQTPEQIAETTLQEDADAVGLSLLSGAHLTLFPRVMHELRERGLDEVLVFGGGVIPDADARALRSQGVAEIFGPGSSLKGISAWLEAALDSKEN